MQEVQGDHQNGRTETLSMTVRRMVAEEAVVVVDNAEAETTRWGSSAADKYGCSLKSGESWSSVGRPGLLAWFYHFSMLPVLPEERRQKADSLRP